MKFLVDIQSKNRAIDTLERLLGTEPAYSQACFDAVKCGLTHLDYTLQGRHLTALVDGGEAIKRYGLIPWPKAIGLDTPIGNLFNKFGVVVDLDGSVTVNGRALTIAPFNENQLYTLRERCICGYLHCSDFSDGYTRSPELLRTLAKCYPSGPFKTMVNCWENLSHPYCISYSVDLSSIGTISSVDISLDDRQDCAELFTQVLFEAAFSPCFPTGKTLTFLLKEDVCIQPDFLQIDLIQSLDWDFEVENCSH